MRNQLGQNSDFVMSEITFGMKRICLGYFHTMADIKKLDEYVFRPLRQNEEELVQSSEDQEHFRETLRSLIPLNEICSVEDWDSALKQLVCGEVLIFVDGEDACLSIDMQKVEKRDIQPPDAEQSVNGPKESFVEELGTNITLIRQRLRDPNLYVECFQLSKRGKQEVAVFYLVDVANDRVVEEVKQRISAIETDFIQGQMHLQELIQDNSFSLFPQIRPTERPDVACSNLLEGSVILLVNGASHALILPVTLFQLMDTVDDYYTNWQYATLIRFVRMLALLFSIAIPGMYLSLFAYNPELIPTRLVISMDAARVKVALPIVLEIFVMEIIIEILREAGLKLPKTIGQAVSIVGGLVIGEAAVNANLVSPITIVIVALTAISSFTAPVYLLGITYRILRFFLLLCSGILGLYGFLLGVFLIHAHIAKLQSFGVPFLAPLSPLRFKDWKDTLVRISYNKQTNRPTFLRPKESTKARSLRMIKSFWEKKR
ncbi:spore germination protein [Brevibacillus sp. GCM10020057]|uniref:spore germination protein n=1 Tax=Brevibacillus sp. GCM10020057 TaxID=3317327 RepID=UPI00362DDB68